MKTRRRSWFVGLCAAAFLVITVAFLQQWRSVVELFRLGEARALLGSWEVVRYEETQKLPKMDPGLRFKFTSELNGPFDLRLSATDSRGSQYTAWVKERQVQIEANSRAVYRFHIAERDRLVLEGLGGKPSAEVRRIRY